MARETPREYSCAVLRDFSRLKPDFYENTKKENTLAENDITQSELM